MKVYVSPSVQEHNVGAGNYGTEEYRMNQIADVVCRILKERNIEYKRNKTTMKMADILADSNAFCTKNDIHIAIHSNAGGGKGTEVLYYKGSANSQKLAQCLYDYVAPVTVSPDRGIKPRTDLAELNGTKAMAALIEVAFHDNATDAQDIISKIEELGIAIANGIFKYMGLPPYVPASTPEPENVLYRVQTGAFNNKPNADNLAAELKRKGFDTYIVQADGLYKVQVGAYSVKSNADAMAAKLKAAGYNTYITTQSGTPAGQPSPTPTIKVRSKVKVKKGAKTYTGGSLASFVYNNVYDVIQINGDRVVIGKGTAVTAAIRLKDLIVL